MKHKQQNRIRRKILKELQAIAFSSVTDICSLDNNTIAIHNNKNKKFYSAVAEIKQSASNSTLQIKMHSKIKALEILAKYYAEETEQEVSTEQCIPDTLLALLTR